MNKIKFVSFAGANIYGISYVGSYKALLEENIVNEITHWTGSSAGALIALFGACNISYNLMESILMETDFVKFSDIQVNKNNITNLRNIMTLISNLGYSKGNYVTSWMQNNLEKIGFHKNITFSEFYNKTGKHITITTTSINTNEVLYLSRSSYPDMKVIDAVHASILLPLVFQPMVMVDPLFSKNKRLLADGAIYDNYPLYAADPVDNLGNYYAINKKSIGFFVHNSGRWIDPYLEINGLIPYLTSLYKGLFNCLMIENTRRPFFWERSVPINLGKIKVENFNVTNEQKKEMICIGYESTKNFLTNHKQNNLFYNLNDDLFFRLDGNEINLYEQYSYLQDTMVYNTNPCKYNFGSFIS